jgi:hypothetical protein
LFVRPEESLNTVTSLKKMVYQFILPEFKEYKTNSQWLTDLGKRWLIAFKMKGGNK